MKTPFLPIRLAVLSSATVLLAACAHTPTHDSLSAYLDRTAAANAASASAAAPASGGSPQAVDQSRAQPIIFHGSDTSFRKPGAKKPPVIAQGEGIQLEFSEAPLSEVLQALLGDLLGLTYTIDYLPEGNVSLRTGGEISRTAVLPMLESMLASHGAVLLQNADGSYRISSAENALSQASGLHHADSLPPGYALVVVPLHYVGAQEMANILRPTAPDNAIVRIDTTRNLLMLAGSRGQHETWLEIIKSFDVDALKGMSLGIFPLEYAAAEDVYETLSAMIGGSVAPADEAAPMPEGGEAAAKSASPLAPPASGVRLFPISRINSLVVISPRGKQIDSIRAWIERLDQPAINELESRLYVYPVQNGSASHLATLLRGLYTDDKPAGGLSAGDGLAPGLVADYLSSVSGAEDAMGYSGQGLAGGFGGNFGGNFGGGSQDMMQLPATSGQNQRNLTTQARLGAQVRVVADERNNALLIRAPRKDYRKIEAALRQLDTAPAQVLIEAAILEVRLVGKLKYGLEWTFGGRLDGSHNNIGGLNLNLGGPIAAIQPGFSWALTNSSNKIEAVLNALAQDSLLRVLSSPSLLVQDNYTASIHVGDQQPVQVGSTTNLNGNVVTSNIEYRNTGVMLTVTPSVNAGGLVSMDLMQTVTDVGDIDQATNQRTFLQRQIKSRVAVRSGETVVMGGLMRDRSINGSSGLPLLSDIPIVGGLFGSQTTDSQNTELLVLITPRVLNSDADLRAVGEEMRQRMKTLRPPQAPAAAAP